LYLLVKLAPLYNDEADKPRLSAAENEVFTLMALQPDKTKDRRDAASIAAEARELFEEWAAEEEAGYKGEVSWEDFKRELNEGRPPHSRPFRNLSSS
jgi:hypothetical protein